MDIGDLFNEDPQIPESVMESARIKADTMAQIFSHIGVDAVNVGEKDLALGVPYLKELEKKWNFPFVSANLTDAGGAPIFKRYIIKNINGKNVGIFGIIGDTAEMSDEVQKIAGDSVKIQDVLESATAVVAELAGKVDYTVALAHQTTNRDWVLARRIKGIDAIIGGQDYTRTENPARAGETLMVRAGEKGQYQGLLEVTFNGGKSAQNSLIPFGEEMETDPEVKAMITAYNDKIVALYSGPKSGAEGSATPVALRNTACESCHSEIVQKWQTTDHAKAYNTLVNKSKQFDPSCLACHTTRFEQPDGFSMKQQQMELVNVQCESCHGNAKDHLAEMKPIPVPDPKVEVCVKCHTKDRCPEFEKDYDAIWQKIVH